MQCNTIQYNRFVAIFIHGSKKLYAARLKEKYEQLKRYTSEANYQLVRDIPSIRHTSRVAVDGKIISVCVVFGIYYNNINYYQSGYIRIPFGTVSKFGHFRSLHDVPERSAV